MIKIKRVFIIGIAILTIKLYFYFQYRLVLPDEDIILYSRPHVMQYITGITFIFFWFFIDFLINNDDYDDEEDDEVAKKIPLITDPRNVIVPITVALVIFITSFFNIRYFTNKEYVTKIFWYEKRVELSSVKDIVVYVTYSKSQRNFHYKIWFDSGVKINLYNDIQPFTPEQLKTLHDILKSKVKEKIYFEECSEDTLKKLSKAEREIYSSILNQYRRQKNYKVNVIK